MGIYSYTFMLGIAVIGWHTVLFAAADLAVLVAGVTRILFF